ncbi:hypothetical protein, partial [Burkholderia ubonensis]|uniref:hypothetical protein n=1 Tax=Burkholderia ubonensis TaxID=101571 RepID=UPI001E337A38
LPHPPSRPSTAPQTAAHSAYYLNSIEVRRGLFFAMVTGQFGTQQHTERGICPLAVIDRIPPFETRQPRRLLTRCN